MKRITFITFLLIVATACKKPYNPPVINSPASMLVVEGVINSGQDSTIIKLSHTVNVSGKAAGNSELNALVTVEGNNNTTYALTETQNGQYVYSGLNLDTSKQYRLRIKTAKNVEYLSDFVPVRITPPIDSIGFNITATPDTGVQIYVNAHDITNKTLYYRWDYQENWEFHAKYYSIIESNDAGQIIARPPQDYIYFCYQSDISSTIVIGSTAKLAKDIVYQSPIIFINSTSEKIETRYSILLRQYALTADAFSFWQNLKKNTEQLGSIFDAEPSQSIGNIQNLTNPAQPAIGYISVSTVQSKRVYISATQLPNWIPDYPYACGLDTTGYGGAVPVDLRGGSFLNPKGFTFTDPVCADCTIRGSKKPPAFWQ